MQAVLTTTTRCCVDNPPPSFPNFIWERPLQTTIYLPFAFKNDILIPVIVLRWLFDFGKELLALFAALLSVAVGVALGFASFDLAAAIQFELWLLLPCLLCAALAIVFLIVIPRYIYWWRYGFPQVPHRSKSRFLARYRKSQPF